VPFGEVFIEERTNIWNTPYLFNAKELDEETGLYYYGARYYDGRVSLWISTDPMQEKYPGVSVYNFCMNNPLKYVDPEGMDWYLDVDGTIQFNPNVNSQKDLAEGKYIGAEFPEWNPSTGRHIAEYRNDGSIIYDNETDAYNRMWSQANEHYQKEREVGAFFLTNGKVLVTPDYNNEKRESSPYRYRI
jgi:RHS repeat-associated protein